MNSSNNLIDYNNLPSNCPLCKQTLGADAINLLNQYKVFLQNENETKIRRNQVDLNKELNKAQNLILLCHFKRNWDKNSKLVE